MKPCPECRSEKNLYQKCITCILFICKECYVDKKINQCQNCYFVGETFALFKRYPNIYPFKR